MLRRSRVPILDKRGRVLGMLAGQPADQGGWARLMEELQRLFEDARTQYRFKKSQRDHRRGVYDTITAGISYGGGQTVRVLFWHVAVLLTSCNPQRVGNLADTAHNRTVAHELMDHPATRRVAGFIDGTDPPKFTSLTGVFHKL